MKDYLDIIYELYPKDIYASDLNYPYTPENIKQWELIETSRKNNQYFEDMTTMLAKQLNCEGHQDFSLRGIFDLSRKAILFLPKNSHTVDYPCCVIDVSIVSNYYCIYFTKFTGVPINTLKQGSVNEAQIAFDDHISRIIKMHYPGYEPFPMEYFNEPVPYVFSAVNYDQYATYFECLITTDIF